MHTQTRLRRLFELLRAFSALALLGLACGCDSAAKSPDSPAGAALPAAQELALALNQDGDQPATSVDLAGLSTTELQAFEALDEARRGAVLQVFVGASEADDLPPVTGATTTSGKALRFTPRYPFGVGLEYRVRFDRSLLAAEPAARDVRSFTFATPRPATPVTRITNVYPTTNELPENLLKFYLHFSAPMGRGEAYRHVHLLDAEGHELPAVFLELGEELWDRDMRRFTLLFDPGRVKRGLVPREELGPVLEAGRDYTLVIDRDWPDAHGQPLKEDYRKPLHVVATDDTPIDVADWKLSVPAAGSKDELVVTFPEPLDNSLLARVLHVTNAAGEAIAGGFDIIRGEEVCKFVPNQPWSAGEYQLVAETTLEDLAGNSIGRAFDVDTFAPIKERIETETVSRAFVIAEPK